MPTWQLAEGPARLGIGFQRTLRIPDDGKNYPLARRAGQFLRFVWSMTTPRKCPLAGGNTAAC